jgi:hypothetical protein
MRGKHFTAIRDRFGNWAITRLSDGASVYLQGDDATEFEDNTRILDAMTYPNRLFKTAEDEIDSCLSEYESVMTENSK